MIIVNTHPNYLALSGNPMLFDISSDNQLATPGVAASFNLVVNGIDALENHYFSFAFDNKTLVFTLADIINDSGLQLPIAEPGDTFSVWAERLYSYLILNFDLISNYIIILNASQPGYRVITFTAKEKGTDWSVAFVNGGSGGANHVDGISVENNVPGVNVVNRENFGIVATIWDEFFDKLGEDVQPVDEIGNVVFDLAEYIRHEIMRDPLAGEPEKEFFLWPPVDGVIIVPRPNFLLKYRASFAEKYCGATGKIYFEPVRLALSGGINRDLLVDYTLQSSDYFAIEANLRRFLTWGPDGKITGTSTPEKLFFFLCGEHPPYYFKLKVRVGYTDGTTYTYTRTPDDTSEEDETVLEILVGHDHLELDQIDPTKSIDYWEVWIENETVSISEIRRFVLDKLYREYEYLFLFKNSLSAYDVVRFVGKREIDNEYERFKASTEKVEAPTDKNAPDKLFDVNEWQRMKVNSGFISRKMKDYLRDLVLSTEVYEVVDNKLFPVVIANAKFSPFFKDQETLYSLDLEYDRSHRDKFYGCDSSVNILEGRLLTADNTIVTADSTIITADQTIY